MSARQVIASDHAPTENLAFRELIRGDRPYGCSQRRKDGPATINQGT